HQWRHAGVAALPHDVRKVCDLPLAAALMLVEKYRTGSGSDRMLHSTSSWTGFFSKLSRGSGRYRSRFCIFRPSKMRL
ncbi:MAG: hypothetical protein ABR568_24165, partial [Pyrinomonadaceae bacterium]